MSYYYYHHQPPPPPDDLEESVFPTGSLRHQNRRNPQSQSSQQYQHCHDNRPYRPQSSTDSIPFVDADASSGQPRSSNLSLDVGSSSSEDTLNRHSTCPHLTKPRITSSTGVTSARRRRRCPPPPPSPPATFLDSEDATSLNNLLDALDDLDVVDEDRRSSQTTTASSREGETAGDEERVVSRNAPPRQTLASILVSIPPPSTTPPPLIEEHGIECRKLTAHQRYQLQRDQPLSQPARSATCSASNHSNHSAGVVPPRPPTSPLKDDNKQKVSVTRD